MNENPIQIKFQNKQNPTAGFDIIRLEELFRRVDLSHSPFHLHLVEFYMIILIEKGVGVHTVDFTQYNFQYASLLTVRKNQIHRFHENENVNGFVLLFTDDFLVSYLEKLEALKSLQLFNELISTPVTDLHNDDYLEISSIVNNIQNEYFNLRDNYSLGIIRSQLHILITKLFRIKLKDNQLVYNRKYLSEFIDLQTLVESNVTKTTKVKDYAKMMGLSVKTINTITQTIINRTAKEFVDDISIKQIKRLLINTELSIKEIAYLSGFEEITNFYKYFKRQIHLTPEQFRSEF